jgi:mitogen-activated protein kinase kinase
MFHRVDAAPHQMMTAPEPEPEREEVCLSDFDWIGDLGAGGFASVSKVRHRRTGAVFALKMSYDPDPDVEEEAEVLRRAAGSPHVVDCHALLRGPDGEPACVLEFMDAGSLSRVLRRRRRVKGGFPEPALAEAAAHCVMGLAQLHSRGVAHMDVKPDNFLANSRGEIKISDFNTSKILYGRVGEHLQVRLTAGTRCYFSPERFAPRARAGPQGAMATDVWGLGVTVLEMFLGRFAVVPDLEKASAAELELAICHGEPLRVPEEAEASAELRGFVAACLQREPTRRATVPQLLRHPFLTGRDVEASRRALRDIIVETL